MELFFYRDEVLTTEDTPLSHLGLEGNTHTHTSAKREQLQMLLHNKEENINSEFIWVRNFFSNNDLKYPLYKTIILRLQSTESCW